MRDDITSPELAEDLRLSIAKEEGRLHSEFESLSRLVIQWAKSIQRAAETGDPTEIERTWNAREARKEDYRAYLGSGAWYKKKALVLARAHHMCERCHLANTTLEVHHLHYGPRGDEDISDLLAVCPSCHSELHGP